MLLYQIYFCVQLWAQERQMLNVLASCCLQGKMHSLGLGPFINWVCHVLSQSGFGVGFADQFL